MVKKIETYKENGFNEITMSDYLVHDSPYMKVVSFNLKKDQELPIHSYDTDGQVCIIVIEGSGEFLKKDDAAILATKGDVLMSDISEPHGIRASSDMRVLAAIAPPV